MEAARSQERAFEVASATEADSSPPESPLAIAGPLAVREPGFQIQLAAPKPALRDASLLEVSAVVPLPMQ